MSAFSYLRERFRKLPPALLTTHMVAKFVFGVGVGLLLSVYRDFDHAAAGWILVIAAVALAMPSTFRLLSGKEEP